MALSSSVYISDTCTSGCPLVRRTQAAQPSRRRSPSQSRETDFGEPPRGEAPNSNDPTSGEDQADHRRGLDPLAGVRQSDPWQGVQARRDLRSRQALPAITTSRPHGVANASEKLETMPPDDAPVGRIRMRFRST